MVKLDDLVGKDYKFDKYDEEKTKTKTKRKNMNVLINLAITKLMDQTRDQSDNSRINEREISSENNLYDYNFNLDLRIN